MIVVGGGVIGLELGSVYARLGSKVDVVEFADKILAPFDNEVSTGFKKICEKQGKIKCF
jgi:dihydrolipoamide dehydrogenase